MHEVTRRIAPGGSRIQRIKCPIRAHINIGVFEKDYNKMQRTRCGAAGTARKMTKNRVAGEVVPKFWWPSDHPNINRK